MRASRKLSFFYQDRKTFFFSFFFLLHVVVTHIKRLWYVYFSFGIYLLSSREDEGTSHHSEFKISSNNKIYILLAFKSRVFLRDSLEVTRETISFMEVYDCDKPLRN